MALRFLKIAVVYLFFGALLGVVMGLRENFVLAPVHAHLVLLGWASLAIAGLIYHQYPAAAKNRLAQIHFWLHNLALPVFMIGLAALLSGYPAAGPVVGISALVVLIALGVFAANVLINIRSAD